VDATAVLAGVAGLSVAVGCAGIPVTVGAMPGITTTCVVAVGMGVAVGWTVTETAGWSVSNGFKVWKS